MIKHFYSYHVETDSLIIDINSLEIEEHEKNHLISLAESQIHHGIINTIMNELSNQDKKLFLYHLNTKDHDKIWKFLHIKIDKIEEKIQAAANAIKTELHKDIKQTREE